MNDVDELLKFYNSNLSDKYKLLSEILKTTFELDGFWYTYINSKGGFFQIGNHPGVGETYFGEKLYLGNPLFCHPDNFIHDTPIITDDFKQDEFHKNQKIVESKHGFKSFLTIPKKKGEAVHLFLFSSSKANLPIHSIFLKNYQALSFFADYFLKAWEPHFSKMEKYTFNMGQILGEKFLKPTSLPLFGPKNEALAIFGQKLGRINKHVQIHKLTTREKECANLILKGNTAPQIAEQLGLSKRTVFDYIDHIKIKVGAYDKSSLIETLHECKQLRLF